MSASQRLFSEPHITHLCTYVHMGTRFVSPLRRWPDTGGGGAVSATNVTLQDRLSRPAAPTADSASGLRARPRASAMFLHDLRFWALGGPCMAVLLLLGGRATALVAAFGVMACYCFDLADNAVSGLFALLCSRCRQLFNCCSRRVDGSRPTRLGTACLV